MNDHAIRDALYSWQRWWNKYGSEWYLEVECPQSHKPPVLRYSEREYGMWLNEAPRAMLFWQEKPRVISEGPLWVATHGGYLYAAETLDELLGVIYTEWQDDKHFVG